MSTSKTRNRAGRDAAKSWLQQAPVDDILWLACSDLEYGEALVALRKEEYNVPESTDPEYSWGFFKAVKAFAYAAIQTRRGHKRASTG